MGIGVAVNAAMTGAAAVGEAPSVIDKMKKELNTPIVMRTDKLDEKNQIALGIKTPEVPEIKHAAEDKPDYTPHILAGSVGALAIADAIRSRSMTAPLKHFQEGISAFKIPTKNPYIRMAKGVINKMKNKVGGYGDAYELYEKAWKRKNNIPMGETLPSDMRKSLHTQFKSDYTVMQDYAKATEENFRSVHGYGDKGFTRQDENSLKEFLKKDYESKLNADPNFLNGVTPNTTPKKQGFKNIDQDVMKGVGMGTGASLASILIHAAGNEYFKNKDNEELRKLIRNSYSVESSSPEYISAQDRYDAMNGISKESSFRDNAFVHIEGLRTDMFNKLQAAKAKLPEKHVMEKEFMESLIQPAMDGITIATVPTVASLMIGKDIRNGLQTIDRDSQNSNQIILDVPINKKASFREDVGGFASGAKKAVTDYSEKLKNLRARKNPVKEIKDKAESAFNGNPEGYFEEEIPKYNYDEFWQNRLRSAVRSVPWVLAPSIVTYQTGKDIRNNLASNVDPGNPPPGYARVVVRTAQNRDIDGLGSNGLSKMSADESDPHGKEKAIERMKRFFGIGKQKSPLELLGSKVNAPGMNHVDPKDEMAPMQGTEP